MKVALHFFRIVSAVLILSTFLNSLPTNLSRPKSLTDLKIAVHWSGPPERDKSDKDGKISSYKSYENREINHFSLNDSVVRRKDFHKGSLSFLTHIHSLPQFKLIDTVNNSSLQTVKNRTLVPISYTTIVRSPSKDGVGRTRNVRSLSYPVMINNGVISKPTQSLFDVIFKEDKRQTITKRFYATKKKNQRVSLFDEIDRQLQKMKQTCSALEPQNCQAATESKPDSVNQMVPLSTQTVWWSGEPSENLQLGDNSRQEEYHRVMAAGHRLLAKFHTEKAKKHSNMAETLKSKGGLFVQSESKKFQYNNNNFQFQSDSFQSAQNSAPINSYSVRQSFREGKCVSYFVRLLSQF